jgi:hypothetical protein
MKQRVKGATNQQNHHWIKEPTNQWSQKICNETMNHESMIQRSNESTNQYNKEQISQRIKSISESVNERITWIKKSVNQWTEWMGEWVDGCMSELISLLLLSYFLCWATSSLSDLFAEASLLSATSSLSSLLSALLLLW